MFLVPNLIGFIDRLIEDTEYVDDMEKFSLSREQVIDEYQLLLDKYHQSLKDKEILGLDETKYLGIKGASIQASLTALVYNLKRMGKITGKTNPR